ncbi:General secretion pathway protein E (plasmid) [Escherichia coli]|nr:General secretion pathway protein E [Escherichia coli]
MPKNAFPKMAAWYWRIGGRAVDVRVSTLPSNHGERIVLRY